MELHWLVRPESRAHPWTNPCGWRNAKYSPLWVMFSLPGVKILTRSTWTELGMDKGTLRCYSQKKWVMDAEKIQTTNMSPRGLLWDWVSESKAKDARSAELVSEAGLLHLKSLRKAGFSRKLWDSDRPWDLNSVKPSSLRFRLAPRPGKGGISCWGNRLPDSLQRYLDAIPHDLHGRRLGSWLGARTLVA